MTFFQIELRAEARRNQGPTGGLAVALACLALLALASSGTAQEIRPDALLDHVRYLASDELAGREAGTPGADSAALYIARQLHGFGVEPLGTEGYLQPFQITTTVAIAETSRLVLYSGAERRELALHREWLPFPFSSAGRALAPTRDAGFALGDTDGHGHAEDPSTSHPATADGPDELDGMVAVVRGGIPQDFSPHAAGVDPTPRFKASRVRQQGAAGALISVARLEEPAFGDPPRPVGIPVGQVLERPDLVRALESADSAEIEALVEPVRERAWNVVGRVRGRDPALADEAVVVGAHYDHLGLGGPGSLAPEVEAPHNGADDNASGTAVLLELARWFDQHEERRPARSLIFVAFSAEEMGLLGSQHFVENPPVPLERVAAMVNFDMVGRLQDDRVVVFGTETAREFESVLDSLDARSALSLSHTGDGYGPSDQTSFYARGIPVLHLFTGTHSEYHRPEDDWPLLNADGLARIAEFSIDLLRALGDRRSGFELVEQERPAVRGGGGYGPYLGTIPDFGEVEDGGVRLTGVRSGSPAEAAGLQAGDVVIGFEDREILNLYDYTYALRAQSPGDTVTIRVRRNGDQLELSAVLERRR